MIPFFNHHLFPSFFLPACLCFFKIHQLLPTWIVFHISLWKYGHQPLFCVDLDIQLKFFLFLIECLKTGGGLNFIINVIWAFLYHFCLLLDYDCQTVILVLTLKAWFYASGFAVNYIMGSHNQVSSSPSQFFFETHLYLSS